MNTTHNSSVPPCEESFFPWWFSLLSMLLLVRFVVRHFWASVDLWVVVGPAAAVLILVGAGITIGRWALGMPMSRATGRLIVVLVCAMFIGLVLGSAQNHANPANGGSAAPAPLAR
jgi:hypothetical protein